MQFSRLSPAIVVAIVSIPANAAISVTRHTGPDKVVIGGGDIATSDDALYYGGRTGTLGAPTEIYQLNSDGTSSLVFDPRAPLNSWDTVSIDVIGDTIFATGRQSSGSGAFYSLYAHDTTSGDPTASTFVASSVGMGPNLFYNTTSPKPIVLDGNLIYYRLGGVNVEAVNPADPGNPIDLGQPAEGVSTGLPFYPGFVPLGSDRVVFKRDITGSTTDGALYATDGTAAGTSLFQTNLGGTFTPQLLGGVNGSILYEDDPTGLGRELVIHDGTTATPIDLNLGTGSSSISDPLADTANGKLYFSATTEGNSHRELVVSDGTVSGTSVLYENTAATGAGAQGPISPTPLGFIDNGKLLLSGGGTFVGGPGNVGTELFIYDPDADTYSLVMDLNPGPGLASSQFGEFIDLGGVAAFVARNGSDMEDTLYATDGTPEGTFAIFTAVGSANSVTPAIHSLTMFDGDLYFMASTADTGFMNRGDDFELFSVPISSIPEPGSLGLLLAGTACMARRRRSLA